MAQLSSGNSGKNTKKAVALPLDLTGIEVVFLSDRLRFDPSVEREIHEDADSFYIYRQTVLKLCDAYKDLVKFDDIAVGPVTIHITEEMAWLLRSKVRTEDMAIDNKTPIGHVLLIKLYSLLSQFNNAMAGYDTSEDTDLETKIIKLDEWKAQHATRGTDQGPC